MCTGKCSRCIAVTLFPLVIISIICNIVLFFPGGDTQYVKDGHITREVYYMGGLAGGGLMVLFSALYIQLTGEEGCCANRVGMFFSITFAAMGVIGALYSLAVAWFALQNGPFCKSQGKWIKPFEDSNFGYLKDRQSWKECTEPQNIVQFNTGLFLTLMVTSLLQGMFCIIQMINGLFGCLCGTCINQQSA